METEMRFFLVFNGMDTFPFKAKNMTDLLLQLVKWGVDSYDYLTIEECEEEEYEEYA